jgi:hypothetical protein
MLHLSRGKALTAVFISTTFVFGSALAASKHTQTMAGLDNLIPKDKWAGAGLDKLTPTEQQSLADDISSLLATPRQSGQAATATPPPVKDHTQWRKLHRQMSKDEVRQLLGEPNTVSVSRFSESWYYLAGSVTFNGKGHLDLWNED